MVFLECEYHITAKLMVAVFGEVVNLTEEKEWVISLRWHGFVELRIKIDLSLLELVED